MAELWRQIPRRVVAKLVAVAAAIGLDEIQPLLLRLEGLRYAVALVAASREPALIRDLDYRGPVDRRIILCRGGEARRGFGGQIQDLARLARDLWRIDEAVAAHPHLVGCLREVRHDIPPSFVRDRHLGEAGSELGRLGNHPNPGFGSKSAGNDPADVVIVDRGSRGLLAW